MLWVKKVPLGSGDLNGEIAPCWPVRFEVGVLELTAGVAGGDACEKLRGEEFKAR